MPVSFLSIYIVWSSGWSNPVWYFSETTRTRYSVWPLSFSWLPVGTRMVGPLVHRFLIGLGDACVS